ncbi:hypothetical protein A4I99_22580 [Salmonella enterica subsp. enterica serovar Reading]|nr:hypothetical protein [Salmonella enterica subsp. enterica serovar Reading]
MRFCGEAAGGGGRLSARAKTPGRLAPAGREAGHADASPVTLPVCDRRCFRCFFRKYWLQTCR